MDYPSHGASRRFLMAMQAWKKLKWPRVIVSRRGSSQGLTPGTQVIVYPDTKLKDGDRVKARW